MMPFVRRRPHRNRKQNFRHADKYSTSHNTRSVIEPLEDRQLMSTYYVSPSGNDGSSGTSSSSAWKTVAKVNAVSLRAGDQVLFQGGASFSGGLKFDSNDKG